MNQLQIKWALKSTTIELLGSQREMKACFCPDCCFRNLKVEFGFLLTSQAQLRAVRPRAAFQGCVSAAERICFRCPHGLGRWVGGSPKSTSSLGRSGGGSTPSEGV